MKEKRRLAKTGGILFFWVPFDRLGLNPDPDRQAFGKKTPTALAGKPGPGIFGLSSSDSRYGQAFLIAHWPISKLCPTKMSPDAGQDGRMEARGRRYDGFGDSPVFGRRTGAGRQ